MKNKAAIILAILVMASFSSCGLPKDNDTSSNNYYSNVRMNTSEYEIYINREMQPILNKLQSHLTNVSGIAGGSISEELELQSLDLSLKEVEETITNIEKIYPPVDYEDRKAQLITQLSALKELYTKYITAINDTLPLSSEQEKFYKDNFVSLFDNISSST